jgi:hypothetical protein
MSRYLTSKVFWKFAAVFQINMKFSDTLEMFVTKKFKIEESDIGHESEEGV